MIKAAFLSQVQFINVKTSITILWQSQRLNQTGKEV